METTEKIVEAYVRYVKGCFTLPNIKCEGQYEIDLLAVNASDAGHVERFHIETTVSISGSYSRLTNKPFSTAELKTRVKQAGQRRTLGYFTTRKFGAAQVVHRLGAFGFVAGNYRKIIVTWDWDPDVPAAAEKAGIELWSFKEILQAIAEQSVSDKTYFMDDTMRTLQLMAMAIER